MPPEDEAGYEPEPEADEPEQVDDPLADYDDDTRALIEAEREKARDEAEAAAEAKINDFKGNYGRRYNATIQDLRAQGYDVADDGKVLVRDANRAAASFKEQVVPLALGQQPPQAEEEITLDPYDTAEELTRKANILAKRESARAVEAATKPLMDRLDQLLGVVGTQARGPAEQQARAELATLGLEALADEEEFAANFNSAIDAAVKQHGVAVLNNPDLIRSTAGLAAFNVSPEVRQRALTARQQPGPTPQQRASAAMRNSTGALGPSRGMGAADYTQEDALGAQILGISVEEYRRLGEDATVDDTLARRRKNGAVRR